MVELALGVAIILEMQRHEIVETLLLQPLLAVFELLCRERDAVEFGTIILGDGLGETTPTTADLEHPIAGLHASHVGDAVILLALRCFERLVARGEHGGRIGHRRVKPLAVEIIAEVVVLGNVLLGAFLRVASRHVVGEVMGRALEQARIGAVEHVPVLEEEAEQRGQVINLDIAVDVGSGKAHRAAPHCRANHLEIVELEHRMQPARRIAHGAGAAVRQDDGYRPVTGLPQQGESNQLGQPRRHARPDRQSARSLFDGGFTHMQQFRANGPPGAAATICAATSTSTAPL